MKAKLQYTKDYDLFEMHPLNRPLHQDKLLEKSMRAKGFMPSSPLQCVRNGSNKLKVLRGHHRLETARRLGIGVYYVIDDSNTDIFDLEGSSNPRWSVRDFAEARARAGNMHIIKLLNFQKRHGLTFGAAASLVGGQSANSGNKAREVKTGTFTVADDMTHANTVTSVVDVCRELQVPFATSAAFVGAVSMCCRVAEFDAQAFIHRVRMYGANLRKRSSRADYLEEIEALYNYAVKKNRIALAFRATEESKRRGTLNTGR